VGATSRGDTPAAVRSAALLVGAEGVAGLGTAAVFVARGLTGTDQHIVNGFGNAAWFGILGAAVLAAAWALWTGRRWGRGIAVFTQLLILPATWYMGVGSHQWFYGIPIAAVALGTLVLLFSPQALRWMSYLPAGADSSGPANADSSGPETR